MNIFDIVLLVIAAVFCLRGLFRGLIREFYSVASVAASLYLASRFHPLLAPYLNRFVSSEDVLKALSFLVVFVGALIACWIVGKVLGTVVKISTFTWLDYLAGGLFGLVEGALLCIVVVVLTTSFLPSADFVKRSLFVPVALEWSGDLARLAPPELRQTLEDTGIRLPDAPGGEFPGQASEEPEDEPEPDFEGESPPE